MTRDAGSADGRSTGCSAGTGAAVSGPSPIQSEEGSRLLADLAVADRVASWHLVTPDGRRYSGGAATAPLARLLPAGAPVAIVAETFPQTTDRVYRWIASHRGALSEHLGVRACAVNPSQRGARPSTPG